jgi:cytochrome c biogenesis protein ResB
MYMTEYKNASDSDNEPFPVEPRYHPVNKVIRKVYDFLASAKLAMALLILILCCCVVGVTVYRGARAGEMIFGALWFNSILVLLVVNVACCFFGRIWYRKLTLITFGMILFHLSFVAILGGIVFNSLFYFRGLIRLTEGETLPTGQLQSYDAAEHGRFFNRARMKGETTLVKMHTGFKVNGADKRVAYEIALGEGKAKNQGILYVTKAFDNNGFSYFRDKEGYTVLTTISDKQGRELYGTYIPLQSYKQKGDSYLYSTGTKDTPENIPFPQSQMKPLIGLQVSYLPSALKEKSGDALFQVWSLKPDGTPVDKPSATGKAAVGATFDVGEYRVAVKEVRYWAGMTVRYEPGKPIILTSLWVGLFGMILTTVGRILKGRAISKR